MMQGPHVFPYQLHNPTPPINPVSCSYGWKIFPPPPADLPPKAGVQQKMEIKQLDSLLNQKTFCFIPGSPFIQFFPHVFVPRKLFKDELLFAKNAQGRNNLL